MTATIIPINAKADLQHELTEQLNINEVFSFNLGGIKIGFDEATVVSWIIMAMILVLSIILTRNLKVTGKISKRQLFLEICYEKMENFFKGIMSKKVEKFIPWLMSMALFIGTSNVVGLFGLKPPTKSMQVTIAMALTSIVIVEYCAFKDKGVIGRFKALTKPVVLTPINVLEIFTKPLSLAMRLFGNVIAAFTIMELVKIVVPYLIPAISAMGLYFDIFDGILQAYIFVFLTALYIQEAVHEENEEDEKSLKKKARKAKKIKKSKA